MLKSCLDKPKRVYCISQCGKVARCANIHFRHYALGPWKRAALSHGPKGWLLTSSVGRLLRYLYLFSGVLKEFHSKSKPLLWRMRLNKGNIRQDRYELVLFLKQDPCQELLVLEGFNAGIMI